jgi:hypothetical protein
MANRPGGVISVGQTPSRGILDALRGMVGEMTMLGKVYDKTTGITPNSGLRIDNKKEVIMRKILVGAVVGLILLGLVIQPALGSVATAPTADVTTPPAIYQGVDKVVTYWWGMDVYLSYRTCTYLGTFFGGSSVLCSLVMAATGVPLPVGLVLVGAAAAIWVAAARYNGGVRVRVLWLWPMKPIVLGVYSQR